MRTLFTTLLVLLFAVSGHAQTAADQYFDPAEMAAARAALQTSHGDQITTLVLGERFEWRTDDDESALVWEAQGWIGNDISKLWIKTEGEYSDDASAFSEAELQFLYSRAISPFWDFQIGLRQDIEPTTRSYAAIGFQGLAPQWLEVDAALFLSEDGDAFARVEVEYELLFTQRLALQPRVEINAALSDDSENALDAGLSNAQLGLRLRYELRREIAPYVGVSYERSFGDTRKAQRLAGESTQGLRWLAGLRFWF